MFYRHNDRSKKQKKEYAAEDEQEIEPFATDPCLFENLIDFFNCLHS